MGFLLSVILAIKSSVNTSIPYVRLSSFYFIYFAALGVFVPYWTVYLADVKGFSALQIGQIMALFMSTKVVAPLVWGWLVDHYGQRLKWIQFANFLTIVCFASVYQASSFLEHLVLVAGFGFFWNAPLPQFEALTLNHLGLQVKRYSSIRLWGSIGFILAVISLPLLINHYGLSVILQVQLWLFIAIFFSTWLVSDKNPRAMQNPQTRANLTDILKQPSISLWLAACVLQQASHGAYYNFLSLYLAEVGYNAWLISSLWALGVLAEVLLFLFMSPLMHKLGTERLFVIALGLTAIRWLLLGQFVQNLPLLILVQLLHAATYGLFHASAIHMVHHIFPNALQGRGQALYSGISYGLGGALGSLISGYTWHQFGATQSFYGSSMLVTLGLIFSLYAMRGVQRLYVA
jgi:PPP family 3-phenylpropionic acid transporter